MKNFFTEVYTNLKLLNISILIAQNTHLHAHTLTLTLTHMHTLACTQIIIIFTCINDATTKKIGRKYLLPRFPLNVRHKNIIPMNFCTIFKFSNFTLFKGILNQTKKVEHSFLINVSGLAPTLPPVRSARAR